MFVCVFRRCLYVILSVCVLEALTRSGGRNSCKGRPYTTVNHDDTGVKRELNLDRKLRLILIQFKILKWYTKFKSETTYVIVT